jgi:hypothetical protein
MLSQHRPQRRLSEHVGRGKVVLHLDDGMLGIDDVEVEHGIDLHGYVIAGDHVLGRDLDDLDP